MSRSRSWSTSAPGAWGSVQTSISERVRQRQCVPANLICTGGVVMGGQRRTTAAVLFGVAAMSLVLVLAAGQSQVSGQAGPKSLLKEIHDKGELRVGLALAEPHQFKDAGTGEWKGIAVDMMKDWAKILGVKFVPVDTSWDTMIPGLEAGKYDI